MRLEFDHICIMPRPDGALQHWVGKENMFIFGMPAEDVPVRAS